MCGVEATLTVVSGHWSWGGDVFEGCGNYPSVSGCLAKTCPAPPAELSHNLNDLSPPWPWPATGSGRDVALTGAGPGAAATDRDTVSQLLHSLRITPLMHCECPLHKCPLHLGTFSYKINQGIPNKKHQLCSSRWKNHFHALNVTTKQPRKTLFASTFNPYMKE